MLTLMKLEKNKKKEATKNNTHTTTREGTEEEFRVYLIEAEEDILCTKKERKKIK